MPGDATSRAVIFDRVLKALDVAGVCSDEEIEISIRVGKADSPKFKKGDSVEALAEHMPGMKGSVGTIELVKDGPYYGIKFPDMEGTHKWLAQNELKSTTKTSGKSATTKTAPTTTIRVVRKDITEEERYVLGIVLEPLKEMGTNDVQQDTYSAAEVRKACYLWMENYGKLGLQHQIELSGQVKVLENWIAPDDCVIGGQNVVKGTWLMGVRVVDDNLWQAVKDGTLTGFSIGGKAQRMPLTT